MALWRCSLSATVEQVRVRFPYPLPYTTLASLLHQLALKGYVTRQKHRNRCWFTPLISHQAYGYQQLVRFVRTHFQGSYPACVAYCVRQGLLPLPMLRDLLRVMASPAQH
jgi:predicted transcriptional regulator